MAWRGWIHTLRMGHGQLISRLQEVKTMPSFELGTLPRNWERAFGYGGDARLVAFYWQPAGDEAMYDDGRASGDGNWQLFLTLKDTWPQLDDLNLGYSDLEADHWLVLDRESRRLMALPKAEAQRRLARQWPPPEPVTMTAEEWKAIVTDLDAAFSRAVAQANRELRTAETCPICGGTLTPGWLPAEDGGFDECPACHGRGLVQVVDTDEV
jgi:hypothetical protein